MKKEILISDIVADPDINIRAGDINSDKVREYAENAENLPPIQTFTITSEKIEVIIDGIHRTASRKEAGFNTVAYENVGAGTREKAQDLADSANLRHGLNLTTEQKQTIARRYKSRHPSWNERKLAEVLGVSPSTAHYWLTEPQKKGLARIPSNTKAPKPLRILFKVTLEFHRWRKTILEQCPLEDMDSKRLEAIRGELRGIAEFYAEVERAIQEKNRRDNE